jgi:sensor histidine kinase YesM
LTSYYIYADSTKKKAQEYSLKIISQVNKNIDAYFQNAENLAMAVAYNPYIQKSMMAYPIKSDYDQLNEAKFVTNALKLLEYSLPDVQITIFSENNKNAFYTIPMTEINPNYNFKKDSWYNQVSKSDKRTMLILNNPQNYYLRRKPVFSLVFRVSSIYNFDTLGYIVMDIDKNQLGKFFENSNVTPFSTVLILGPNNDEIYSNTVDFSVKNIKSLWEGDRLNGVSYRKINNKDYMVIFGTSQYTGWKIVNIIPLNMLLKEVNTVMYLYLFIFIILFAFITSLSYKFSSNITVPLAKLKEGMDKVKQGDLGYAIAETSHDEIGELIDGFNNMICEMDFLIKKNKSMDLLKKEAELKALQNQINPHFLYNTLEMIIGLASIYKADDIIAICKGLGGLFRYNLSSKDMVSIREELDEVKRYIYIMQNRFDGRFSVLYDIDETIINCKTAKFTIQPFVENAISHGFDSITKGGLIKILVKKKDGNISLSIFDNGKGMNDIELASLNERLQSITEDPINSINIFDNLGILNVHIRLTLLFGDNYTLSIKSAVGEGTSININIPIIA